MPYIHREMDILTYDRSGTSPVRGYIFDLDGTLADNSHRLPHIHGNEKDWEAYNLASDKDAIWDDVINIAQRLYLAGSNIFILTGRSEIAAEVTRKWLRDHGVLYHTLIMRTDGNREKDYVLKKKWYEKYVLPTGSRIAGVFEDRTQVVQMWRSLGLTVFQNTEGNY